MKREAAIAIALAVAILGSGGFIAAYAAGGDRLYEGLALALAAAGLCAALLGWAFWIVPDEQVVDRLEYPSPPQERALQTAVVAEDLREVTRPRLLLLMLGGAVAAFCAALVVPFRSLGLAPDGLLFHTRWRNGERLVREDGSFVHVNDLAVDSATTVFPESAVDDPQSQAMLIRLPAVRQVPGDTAEGYVAYSKICTHAGCPVALYRAKAQQLLCPCHQSLFDVVENGAVVSGPADHPLPRLPLIAGPDGILRAAGDFNAPVGPGFWERG